MQVSIDQYAGFCPGVTRAVKLAEQHLQAGKQLFCLGEIVHNQVEVKRLERLGLRTISYEEFNKMKNTKVLLRSHGEPPETYEIARQNNITLIDATCGTVIKLQKKVQKAAEQSRKDKGQVVIFGKNRHPEVVSLAGQTGNSAIVVEGKNDLEQVDFNRPVKLFAQTTMQPERFEEIEQQILDRMKENRNEDELDTMNSICKQVSKRVPRLREFAGRHDIVLFVSGKNSSNGKFLYSICKEENAHTYFIADKNDLQREWFVNKNSVGISGATSTPGWLLEEIANEVETY